MAVSHSGLYRWGLRLIMIFRNRIVIIITRSFSSTKVVARIISANGQLARVYSVHKNSTTFTPDLPAGLYHISVLAADKKYVSRLVIE